MKNTNTNNINGNVSSNHSSHHHMSFHEICSSGNDNITQTVNDSGINTQCNEDGKYGTFACKSPAMNDNSAVNSVTGARNEEVSDVQALKSIVDCNQQMTDFLKKYKSKKRRNLVSFSFDYDISIHDSNESYGNNKDQNMFALSMPSNQYLTF